MVSDGLVRMNPSIPTRSNGAKFKAVAVRDWLARLKVRTLFIVHSSPKENGYNESFNGKMRNELQDIEDILRKYAKKLLSREKILSTIQTGDQSIKKGGESYSPKSNLIKPQKEDPQVFSGKDTCTDQIEEDKSAHEMNKHKNIGPEKILLLCIFLPI